METAAPRGESVKPETRLKKIAQIIEAVDNRCMTADGPVTETRFEMTTAEMRQIYKLATGTKMRSRRKLLQQSKCRTLEQLVLLGRKREYARPDLWAQHIMKARASR